METQNSIELFRNVRDYYVSHQHELSVRKQFHFFSRLYLWSRRTEYHSTLENLRDEWLRRLPRIYTRVAQIHLRQEILKKIPKKEYRIHGMQKFFQIEVYNRLFFRGLFDTTVFGNTAITGAIKDIDQDFLVRMREVLMQDREALFSLATPAVNFLTLSNYFFGDNVCPLSYEEFVETANRVTLSHEDHDLDARIYFYTHAIIGASHFYARSIPDDLLLVCTVMVQRLEETIEYNYDALSLDHKCEFMVCAILCGYETTLAEQIRRELTLSISPQGTFFINTLNAYAQKRRAQTFSLMEHTNVLALMAFLPKNTL